MNSNYEIIEKRNIADLNSEGIILRHKKTNAMVTLLLNDDENKVFYIGFRTTPKDSTGVAHILEHSTLCGSKAFPAKDPFIELAKGSLNTFLNAMTFPDKTVYPVASCNDKDFHNLVHVYLDAVFYPNIFREDKIFKQEGWHYELENAEDELKINGVVYNEMKGVYSSPDSYVDEKIMASLYPDTTYGFASGGDPECIPKLTYEDFLKFHDTYYHPSNSFIYLYGNLDAEEYLTFIDENYLKDFDAIKVDSEIMFQKPFEKPVFIEENYPVLDENDKSGVYLSYNISMGSSLDPEFYIAAEVLDYVLCSSPGAIVKKALIDAGIGEDVYSNAMTGILQPYFSIIAKNASKTQKDEFVRIIEDTLRKLSKDGLPHRSILAALNRFEFKYREADFGSYPRGLILGLQSLDSWIYDPYKPFMHIEANATYAKLKNSIEEGYFEKLIKNYFVDNNHKTVLMASPKAGLTAKKDEELRKALEKYKKTLNSEEIDEIITLTKELKEYQKEPSSKEDIQKIPMLRMEDLKREAVKYVNEEIKLNDITILNHDIFTSGISYISLMFSVNDLPAKYYPYLGLFKEFLGYVDTDNYSYQDLFDETNMYTGGMITSVTNYVNVNDQKDINGFLSLRVKVLYENTCKAFELMDEVMFSSKFDDYSRLKELMFETKAKLESGAMSSGHVIALSRALSYFSKSSSMEEYISGIPFLRLVQNICADFENRKEELGKILSDMAKCIFRPENLFVNYTGTAEGLAALKDEVNKLIPKLYTTSYEKERFIPEISKKNEGFLTSGQIQYVCRAGSYKEKNLPYTGALRVLHTILGYDYLWNNVRVLGGAYGVMNSFTRGGNGYIVSYRDPNLSETIEIYEKASEYIKNIELDDRQILQYIIGTLSDLDVPMTPSVKGDYGLRGYLTRLSDEDVQKERDEILGVSEKIIRDLHKYLEAILSEEYLCVVGNAEKINENKELFYSTENLI